MALATNTTTGEIKLAGDLAGSNDGNAPELTNTAVTPGEYTVAKVTVDSKGRITNAINSTSNEITGLIDAATVSSTGVVQVGSNLYITGSTTSGDILITFSPVISAGTDATGLTTDVCATYSIDISVDDATAVTVEFDGAGHQTIQDILDTLNGVSGLVAALDTGHIRITSTSTGNTSNISLTNDSIFNCVTNFDSIGASIRGISPCELYAKDATDSIAGVIQAGSGVTIVAGVLSVDTASYPLATTTTSGGVIVPVAGNLDIDGSGNISVPLATNSTVGVLEVDNSNGLTIIGGVLALDGSNISDLPIATNSTKGILQVTETNGLTITAGVLDFTGPDATTGSKGIIQVGTNLSVSSGVLSGTYQDATTGVKGIVQIGAGIDVAAGVISTALATVSSIGAVSIGAGISIDGAGEITADPIADATTSSKGLVQIGAGIDVAAGVISGKLAETSVLGVVKVEASSNLTIVSGDIDTGTNVPLKDENNTFTKSQYVSNVTLTSAASVTPNGNDSNNFELVLGESLTLENISNLVTGAMYSLILKQDGSGARVITYGANYKFKTGADTVLSAGANDVNILNCITDGTNLYCTLLKDF